MTYIPIKAINIMDQVMIQWIDKLGKFLNELRVILMQK